VKAENRGAIFGGVARFYWQNGWFLLTRFLDKVVVPWVVHINRGAIFLGVAQF